MRLTYILAIAVMATIHASATAISAAKDSKAAVENGAVAPIVASTLAEGGRMLRRVDHDSDDSDDFGGDFTKKDDDDVFKEERGFGDAIKKLNPVTAVKKSVKQTAKIKKALKDSADYQRMIERAREMVKDT